MKMALKTVFPDNCGNESDSGYQQKYCSESLTETAIVFFYKHLHWRIRLARVPPRRDMGAVEVLLDGDGVPARKNMGPVEVLLDGDGVPPCKQTDACEN